MTIRKIQTKDLKACAEILQQAYSLPPYNEKFIGNNALNYIKNKFKHCATNSYVAYEEKKVVGFVFINLSTWTTGPQAVIEEIVIAPQAQGQGWGQKLLTFVQQTLKKNKVKSIMLWAKKDERLDAFYQKNGYEKANDFIVRVKNLK